MAAGEFGDEMTPIEVVERFPDLATGEVRTKTRTVSLDEGARPDTSLEGLAKLRPVFAAKGSVTAGNSIADQRRRRRADPGQREARSSSSTSSRWRASSASPRAACRPRSWASARSRPSRRR